jgi:glycosyltransferase involved in cell wall biosynthesis
LDRAAFVHVLNADEGQLLQPLGLACPVTTVPNGVFPEELAAVAGVDFFQSTLGFPGNRAIIFLGRLHHKKGLDYLAAAFSILARRIPDAQLVVAGPDEGAQMGFMDQIDRAGLRRRVHVVGPLYGVQKHAALRSAACFCLPSRQEGFSIAILEAMACRLPVVISDACHFPEVAEFGAGQIVPLESERIAAALADVLQNRDSARRMGEAGLQLVESRFTWNRVADQFVDEYERSISAAAI